MYQFTVDQYFNLIKRALMAYGYYTEHVEPSTGSTPFMSFYKEGNKHKRYIVAYNIPDGTYLDADITFEFDPLAPKKGVKTFLDRQDFMNAVREMNYEQALILVDAFVKSIREKISADDLPACVLAYLNDETTEPFSGEVNYCMYIALYADAIRNMKSLSDYENANRFYKTAMKYKEQ